MSPLLANIYLDALDKELEKRGHAFCRYADDCNVRGWWSYFELAQVRRPIFRLDGWIRRHIRKCFWLRWHNASGREHALRRLGLQGRLCKAAFSTVREERGTWPEPAACTRL